VGGLVTGEAVLLDLRPARLASRLLAALLDGLLLLALGLAGAYLFSRVPVELDPAAVAAIGTVLVVGLVVGYPTLWEVLTRGRTPGKAALGLRVVRDDGGPVRFRHALTRALTLLVDLPMLHLPSLVVQVFSERGKGLGDVLAGTFVVTERVPTAAATAAAPMPPQLAGWAAGLDLSRLPDDLALTVRQFLGRAPALAPAAREAIGSRLTAAVAATTSPPPPPGTPGWAYLSAVLAERRRRAEGSLGAGSRASWPSVRRESAAVPPGGPGGRAAAPTAPPPPGEGSPDAVPPDAVPPAAATAVPGTGPDAPGRPGSDFALPG
jgi:uncharacterized RDD family membrane protein YckC